MAERSRGLLLLKNDVICWVITVGVGGGGGAENNADCLHALKTLFSILHNSACPGVSPSKAGRELGDLPSISLVNSE